MLLLVPFDKVKLRQVYASKRLGFYVPFLDLSLRKPQMKYFQAVLHLLKKERASVLDVCTKKKKAELTTRKMPSPRAFRHLYMPKKNSK